jgi:hypothetical protein
MVWVGDASMAPWELYGRYHSNPWGSSEERTGMMGLDWLRRMKDQCPSAVWMNPDPQRFWEHPTVSAIGGIFPMFPLTVDGLRDAVRKLRVPV